MTEWPFWSPCPCLIVKFYPRSPNGTWTLGPSTFDWFWSHFDRVNLNVCKMQAPSLTQSIFSSFSSLLFSSLRFSFLPFSSLFFYFFLSFFLLFSFFLFFFSFFLSFLLFSTLLFSYLFSYFLISYRLLFVFSLLLTYNWFWDDQCSTIRCYNFSLFCLHF